MDQSWNIGVQVQWNIFDGGLLRASRSSQRTQLVIQTEKLTQTLRQLTAETQKLEVNLKSLDVRINLQTSAVDLSQRNYEDARGHYRAGTITLTRLGEFNLVYAEARFNLQQLYYLKRQQILMGLAMLSE